MAIRKRAWVAPDGTAKQAWLVDYRDIAGKRRSRQFTRKKDAETFALTAATQVRDGTHTHDRDSIDVAAAADLWIAKSEREGRERSTVKSYRELARLHIVPLIGGLRLSRLTRPQVESFRDQLLDTRSKAMAGKAVRSLSMIISEAQRRGLVAQNVAQGVKVVRASRDREPVVVPAATELRALLQAARDEERPIVGLLISSGMRSSELRGLDWSAIDLKAATVTITQRADAWGVIGPPKSRAGRRTIPLPPEVVKELKAHKLRTGGKGLLLPSATGGPLRRENLLRRWWAPLCARARLSDAQGTRFGMHALRHAAASNWISAGVDLKRLQSWLGHASAQMTLDTYGHLMADDKRDTALAHAASRGIFGSASAT
ncbi:site-specific integrase [Altererythrobacter sp. TH136]|uniref:tyrosine-type recombinase/integrase n=1 Tax=Altererythrobacter sp. TH136 TaxID=2067415 RepID=UPI001FEFD052|nr:site-specific integrase [Altererythrobacter sp. TH136]